jgi:FMN phosphatase YigB (HAD superfamily)
MLIGLDFDNTIVSYDRLFHRLAVERGLIPVATPATKQAVRDALRFANREDDWTELQGITYGPRIADAEPFAGAKAFLRRCREAGVRVAIISHKTRHPYRGEKHDLHNAAHAFLELHGFYKTSDTGLTPDRVFLELTLAAKLARIGVLGCTTFVDDLPEVLAERAFPSGVRKVLFDPANTHADHPTLTRVNSWEQCGDLLLSQEACA